MHCVWVFSVELEGLAPNGFGKVMEIEYRGTSTVFFKFPGDLIDGEIGPHSGYLQSARMDIQRCQETIVTCQNCLTTFAEHVLRFILNWN